MNLLTSIRGMFSSPQGLVCPRCEHSIEGHDEAACQKKMSRRFFFQVAAGGAVAIAAAEPVIEYAVSIVTGPALSTRKVNGYLTTQMITSEMLRILHNDTFFAHEMQRHYNRHLYNMTESIAAMPPREALIGRTVSIRKPRRFRGVA